MSKIVILTGAGISAESGIKTFRDNNGLWNNYEVDKVCKVGCLENNRDETIKFYDERRMELKDKTPNKAHKILANLKKIYKDDISIITQNVDDLFEKAGLNSDEIIHLHGFLKEVECEKCGLVYDIGYKSQNEAFNGKCPSCFSDKIRPNIVMFGEKSPKYKTLYKELEEAEILVVIGTSGVVLHINEIAKLKNLKIKILNNLEKSESIDESVFDYVFYEKATTAITKIEEKIKQFLPEPKRYIYECKCGAIYDLPKKLKFQCIVCKNELF